MVSGTDGLGGVAQGKGDVVMTLRKVKCLISPERQSPYEQGQPSS